MVVFSNCRFRRLDKGKDNPDARGKILQLKDELFDGAKYKDNMNGFKIYEKVLGEISDSSILRHTLLANRS